MDITLERILSLLPKKPDGKVVHGAKKAFCGKIGAPPNIFSEWERNVSRSYRNYLYQISSEFGVSVEWLRGETDIKKPSTQMGGGLDENPKYAQLNDENRAMVDSLIEKLLIAQLSD